MDTSAKSETNRQADQLLVGVPDGDGLTDLQIAYLQFGLNASATVLDTAAARRWAERTLALGASPEQLHEIVTLMSSIGVHAFFESTRLAAALTEPAGGRGAFDPDRQALWDRHIGERRYWTAMREEIPGFLEALLWMDPDAFVGFLDFAGLPFRAGRVETLTKEIISMAADASSAHRYLPGMRMHLRNAVSMGCGARAIRQALEIAAESSEHVGVA
ncbi:hypothetical protein [Agromyces sp. NPDC049794]|uniref:carboxymuconolactone decarboxylase family protein n=1 Tax=unclassified Agromyces TaxID=2639701 RepID=UPI0033C485CB